MMRFASATIYSRKRRRNKKSAIHFHIGRYNMAVAAATDNDNVVAVVLRLIVRNEEDGIFEKVNAETGICHVLRLSVFKERSGASNT
eukprot:11129608-Ditylum_brightwellii.AAC.1